MRGLPGFLLRRDVVLAAFLLLKLAAVVIAGLTLGTAQAWAIGVLALAVYGVIAWFARSGRLISIWAITIIILYEASGALLTGVAQFKQAPGIGLLGIAVAAYLLLGALSVFSGRHARR
ncbi:MAG: hypothetical protein H0S80_08470 [Desulfovibrionaceae bacterium]|nr:hypothetical protein [Desulfovibrionaceae bacterium]